MVVVIQGDFSRSPWRLFSPSGAHGVQEDWKWLSNHQLGIEPIGSSGGGFFALSGAARSAPPVRLAASTL